MSKFGSIKDKDSFWRNRWNVDGEFNKSLVSAGIAFSDADGQVERNGCVLHVETKTGDDLPIPVGQMILFKALSSKRHYHVVVLWGVPPCDVHFMQRIEKGKPQERIAATENDFHVLVAAWLTHANGIAFETKRAS